LIITLQKDFPGTFNLLFRVASFERRQKKFVVLKADDLNRLEQESEQYQAFLFIKNSTL
jgi:hypothetical protein